MGPALRLAMVMMVSPLGLGGTPSPASQEAGAALRPPPPPPPVSPSATVLFADDFRTMDNWHADRDSVWSVQNGVLRGQLPNGRQERSFLFAGSEDWRDYAVDVDVCQWRGVDKGLAVCVTDRRGVGVDLRGGSYQDVLLYRHRVPLGRAKAANSDSVWHHLRVETRGARYAVLVDGQSVLERRDLRGSMQRGRIALAAYTGGQGECEVLYANLLVTSLEGQP